MSHIGLMAVNPPDLPRQRLRPEQGLCARDPAVARAQPVCGAQRRAGHRHEILDRLRQIPSWSTQLRLRWQRLRCCPTSRAAHCAALPWTPPNASRFCLTSPLCRSWASRTSKPFSGLVFTSVQARHQRSSPSCSKNAPKWSSHPKWWPKTPLKAPSRVAERPANTVPL